MANTEVHPWRTKKSKLSCNFIKTYRGWQLFHQGRIILCIQNDSDRYMFCDTVQDAEFSIDEEEEGC